MDVIKYLENDHTKVLDLLAKLQKLSTSAVTRRQKQFEFIKIELYLHEQVEQQILYPALKAKDKDDILEAYQEHHVVNLILADIESVPFDDESWQAKITVLTENLKHHIKEERSKLFPLTKKHFDKPSREEMMLQMQTVKKNIKREIKNKSSKF